MSFFAELHFYDPSTSSETQISFTLGPGITPSDASWFPPGLNKWVSPGQKISIDNNGIISVSTDKGEIDILNPPSGWSLAGPWDYLITKIFQGRMAYLYWIPDGGTYSQKVLCSSGILEQPYADPAMGQTANAQIVFPLRDPRSTLTADIQPTLYAGTNVGASGVEGTAADIMGKPKPIIYGRVSNIPGVQVNQSQLIWQIADKSAVVDCVRDGGVALTASTQRGNLASLLANTPPPGYYDWCNVATEGTYIKVGSTPQYSLCFDAYEGATVADRTIAQIWSRLSQDRCGRTSGSLDSTAITACDTLDSGESGFYWDSETNQLDALNEVLQSFSGFEFLGVTGLWEIAKVTLPPSGATTVVDLVGARRFETLTTKNRRLLTCTFVRPDYSPDGSIPYQVTVNWGRAYQVMSTSDFAGAAVQRLQQKFAQEYRTAVATDNTIWNPTTLTGPWINAPAFTMTSSYAVNPLDGLTCPAAVAEASRLLAIFGNQRMQAQLTFEGVPGDIINPGDVIGLTLAQYGLSSGALFRVIQPKEQLDVNGYQISLIIGLQRLPSDP